MTPAQAQVVPDDSLGDESSILNRDATINGSTVDKIEGGAVRGSNLFHSFQELSISDGQQLYFANPQGITDILSRVTGNNVSEILGTLGVDGAANLWLLNPNGIIFGENATLDLNGSFVATTAVGYQFEDYSYDVTNPDLPPLLTVNIPVGLQFGSDIGAIEVRGTGHNLSLRNDGITVDRRLRPPGLEVASDSTLALIGGTVDLKGANLTASGGNIVLGSVAEAEQIGLSTDEVFTLEYNNFSLFGEINLNRSSSIDLSGNRSGSLQIQAENINLLDNSAIISNTFGALDGGAVELTAANSLNIIGTASAVFPSAIFSRVGATATGNGSRIAIAAPEFSLQDNALIASSTSGSGNAGAIDLSVDRANIANRTSNSFATGLISQVSSGGTGAGADINFEAEQLQLLDGAQINLRTNASGRGGNLFLSAEQLNIAGISEEFNIPSAINTRVGIAETANQGGDLDLRIDRLSISDGAQINSSTRSDGRGGQIAIEANDIEIAGSSSTFGLPSIINTTVATPSATGNGGDLKIDAERILLDEGGRINTETRGLGNAGALNITAADLRVVGTAENTTDFRFPSSIFTTIIQPTTEGNGGDLTIEVANTLKLESGGNISSLNNGLGNSGDLTINAAETIIEGISPTTLSSSGLFTNTTQAQNGGQLSLRGQELTVQAGGAVGSSTSGIGRAGDLNVAVGDAVTVTGIAVNADDASLSIPSSLFANVEENALGNGGALSITTEDLTVERGGKISASTSGIGDAGSIFLNAQNIAVRDSIEIAGVRSGIGSGVEAKGTGNGGSINLNAGNLLVARGGAIGVDARAENINRSISAGSISITADNVELEGTLSDAIVDIAPSSFLPSRVSAFSEGNSNSGDVSITANRLTVADGADVSVRNLDLGNAGNINLNVGELTLDRGQLNAEVNSGTQGNVILNTENITVSSQGGINTQATGSATSGNITINNSGNIILEDSEIVADATQGNAGNIQINTQGLFSDRNSVISASSELGIDGNVEINAFDLARGVESPLPEKPLDPDVKSTQSCDTNDNENNFAYIGRGGLPENPLDTIVEQDLAIDWTGIEEVVPTSSELQDRKYSLERSFKRNTPQVQLTEAGSWRINSAGKVELVALRHQSSVLDRYYPCRASK